MKTDCWAVHSIYGLEVFETRAEAEHYYRDMCDEAYDNAIEIGSWPYDSDNTVLIMKIERVAHPVEPTEEEERKCLGWHWEDKEVIHYDD